MDILYMIFYCDICKSPDSFVPCFVSGNAHRVVHAVSRIITTGRAVCDGKTGLEGASAFRDCVSKLGADCEEYNRCLNGIFIKEVKDGCLFDLNKTISM